MKAFYMDMPDGSVKKISDWQYEGLTRLEGYLHRINSEFQAVIFNPKVRGKSAPKESPKGLKRFRYGG